MTKTRVSVVLPAYNEVTRIKDTALCTIEALEGFEPYEVILAEDGSSDGTDEECSSLELRYPQVIHLHSKDRLGRGQALLRAFNLARGETVAYMDVDMATQMRHLRELIGYIEEGYDVATGSRLLPQSEVSRTLGREITSRGFNLFVRLLLRSRVNDHQCGFKAFKRSAILPLFDEVRNNGWFWDTEVLVRSQAKGYRIKEFPVEWWHGGDSKVHLFRDITQMGSSVIKLWWEMMWGR